MSEPKISVIIPMYNAEKFIRQTLISVLASKFKDYEVIVVDDCSTDSSVAEAEKLLSHFDGRLKILSTEKNSGGPGIPRNVGIKNSAGKYICFLDADDFLLPTALGNFFDAAEKYRADVVHTVKAFVFNDTDGKIFSRENCQLQSDKSDDFSETPRLEVQDLGKRMTDYIDEKFLWQPWGKLFRFDFLAKNKIDFPVTKLYEDTIFCFKCLCLAKRYLRVSFATNIYRIRSGSVSKRTFTTKDSLKFILEIMPNNLLYMDEFMGGLKFFLSEPQYRYAVIKFFMDMHFKFLGEDIKTLPPHEVEKIFFDELQNPELNTAGKNLVFAYLFAERVLGK